MKTIQLRRMTDLACDGPFGSAIKSDHYSDSGARVVRLGNIGSAEWRDGDAVYLAEDYFRSLIRHDVRVGDLLIAGLGDDKNPVGRAAVAPPGLGSALVKADCYRFRLRDAEARFLAYYLSSTYGIAASAKLAEGSTRKRLTLGKALALRVPDLPLAEQRAISDYLDAETARIDALIAKKQQLILLLALRFREGCREASFSNWQMKMPLRRVVSQVQTGTTPSSEFAWTISDNGPVDWYTPGDFGAMLELGKSGRRLHNEAVRAREVPVFPAGSVLIVGIGATAGKIGFAADSCSGNQQVTAVSVLANQSARFLAWQLWSRSSEMRELAPYTTLPILNNDFLRSFEVAAPPLQDQQRVVETLDADAEVLRQLTGKLASQIDLLAERRQALITAAVTGEFKIPGVA